MQQNITFIGAGHITEILIHNLIKSGICDPLSIMISDPDKDRISELKQNFGVISAQGNKEAVSSSDVIFVCVHPHIVPLVLDDLKSVNVDSKVFISVSAGVPLSLYEGSIENVKAARILPNPPSRIGEGAVPVTMNSNMLPEDKAKILPLIQALGPCFTVSEDKIDIFTSVTSPAPVLTFFESMIDSAVLCGLDHKTSSAMVFQTVKGCLKMWEECGVDIKELITQACTPAGTSVESLRVMDKMCFRSAVKESYYAAWLKSKSFGADKH